MYAWKTWTRASALAVALGTGAALAFVPVAQAGSKTQSPPQYRVVPSWPKQLPNNWLIGQVGGLAVDSHDHIWIIQRPRTLTADEAGAAQTPPRSQCCFPAPSVIEFDKEGNMLQAWGGPGYVPDWPATEHGIWVDKQGFVWVAGNGGGDRMLLKFTNNGTLAAQIGHAGDTSPTDNTDTTKLGRVANMWVDDAAHEVYVADGYQNKRIVVYDSDTLAFKRGWGAYGKPLSAISNPPAGPYDPTEAIDTDFRNPVHYVALSKDGLVYVSDRVNDRIQVFTKQGAFVKEFFLRPETLGNGSTWQAIGSADAKQAYLLVPDGENNVVWILNRATGAVVSSFGHNGRNAGQFHWVHVGGLDSDGALYLGEVDTGKRVQKFVLRGDDDRDDDGDRDDRH
jgi:DNA-binding beta-propeller fold protein YncE